MSNALELIRHIKQEPLSEPMSPGCEEAEEEVEIEPLSGNPFFHVMLLKSHVCSPFQLVVPAKFIRFLPFKLVSVILIRGSRSWEILYHGESSTHKRFDSRWKQFVADNKLNIGDACLFELMACEDALIKFKVQVLRGDFPSVLLDQQDGTREKPLFIDDE